MSPTSKRFLAALLALCALAAPAALAATTAGSGGTPASAGQTQTEPTPAEERAAAAAAKRRAVHRLAARRNVRLVRKVAALRGDRVGRAYARKASVKPLRVLQRSNYRLRRELRSLRRERTWQRLAFRRVPASVLRSIAQCESHGDPRAIGGGGRYRGMFQMTFHIWGAVGGEGDPAAASRAEQYYRAALVYTRYGSGQWPHCGR